MVEFVLIAPVFILVLVGVVVTGVVVMNIIALNNGLRDAARAAAVCGSKLGGNDLTATLPDNTACTTANLQAYVQKQVNSLHGGAQVGSIQIQVIDPSNPGTPVASGFSGVSSCVAGKYQVKIHAVYGQPLYLPVIGVFLGSNGSTTTRQLDGTAEATCER
jgi:Flp pilus assembly protein TadG